jgi:hypothetical protein
MLWLAVPREHHTLGERALPARTLTLIFIVSPPFVFFYRQEGFTPQTRRERFVRRRKAARFSAGLVRFGGRIESYQRLPRDVHHARVADRE